VNKAASLTGLTVMTLAFCPTFDGVQRDLLWHSMLILWPHSIYSAYKFYGSQHIPKLSTWPDALTEITSSDARARAQAVKKISIVLGIAGQLVLWAGRPANRIMRGSVGFLLYYAAYVAVRLL
jgi:hypothetical protein